MPDWRRIFPSGPGPASTDRGCCPPQPAGGLRWNWMSGEYLRDEITTQLMVAVAIRERPE